MIAFSREGGLWWVKKLCCLASASATFKNRQVFTFLNFLKKKSTLQSGRHVAIHLSQRTGNDGRDRDELLVLVDAHHLHVAASDGLVRVGAPDFLVEEQAEVAGDVRCGSNVEDVAKVGGFLVVCVGVWVSFSRVVV